MQKTCTKCNETKDLHEFPLQSTAPSGHKASCKRCGVLYTQARQKSPEGLIKKIYHNQHKTCKRMGRAMPSYTEKELFAWAMQHDLMKLWQTWTDSGHDVWLSPSVDRLDNTISYTLTNIQLVTWRENMLNQKKQNVAGIYLHTGSKAVDQLTLEGEYIRTYPSIAIAMRDVAGHSKGVSNITAICEGKWVSAYGYKWRFAEVLS